MALKINKVKVAIGMRRSWWAPLAPEPSEQPYGEVKDMGAARLGTLTVTTASGDVEGDDHALMHIERFVSGSFVAETTLSDLELNATVYGHTYNKGEETSGGEDDPPLGGYGFIEPMLQQDQSVVYRATFLPRVSANQANEAQNAATRQGGSINPAYNSVTYTVYEDEKQGWRKRKDLDTLAEAESYLAGLFSPAG